ncbi:NAD(P)/FAD-dependent oxidoreductase [Subsaxibacter sp. CAU 1640]|uniref:NAD(P)/FAD-dependent oxidoreductase n=1 Tax=Subsaxibacter sp. CAU 1640 TaxID=2933271 RepID=UPI0020044BF4|nr:NAD(P)/FAD-dependent oxidoreductase [Subsaxibacter sp. CAU 1640]MCK7591902.1 NAD(P)/FAD-dependent oxidoreductase [Subsaxibacter sp. CAU 1640]
MKSKKNFEVIIIGGSYAGLSAAMSLGRTLRDVLVIDSGLPCNRQTPHSQNFLTQDGEAPAAIAKKAKKQVLKYKTVTFYDGLAIKGKKTKSGFSITTEKGDVFNSKKLIFATGIKDIMPGITGFSECWGISVVHCPYCHGYELRGKKTALFAEPHKAFHLASLVSNLTDDLSIITSDKVDFPEEQLEKLKNNKLRIIEKSVKEIIHRGGQIEKVIYTDDSEEEFDAMYAALPFEQHCSVPEEMGCELTELGHLRITAFQQTTIEGVYACGDNSAMMRSLANAVYTGNLTGAIINKELSEEAF